MKKPRVKGAVRDVGLRGSGKENAPAGRLTWQYGPINVCGKFCLQLNPIQCNTVLLPLFKLSQVSLACIVQINGILQWCNTQGCNTQSSVSLRQCHLPKLLDRWRGQIDQRWPSSAEVNPFASCYASKNNGMIKGANDLRVCGQRWVHLIIEERPL